MPLTLPYAHLNLRCNPFGELTSQERIELAVVEFPQRALDSLQDGQRYCLQLLGDSGRGKTTHLLALLAQFPGASYVRVPLEGRVVFPAGSLLLVDEIQHVPPRKRRQLFRRKALTLVLGTHQDLSAELDRAGFRYETLRPARGLNLQRLGEIVRLRLEWARRDPGPIPQLAPGALERLLTRYGDNARAIEHHLYEVFQQQREVGSVKV